MEAVIHESVACGLRNIIILFYCIQFGGAHYRKGINKKVSIAARSVEGPRMFGVGAGVGLVQLKGRKVLGAPDSSRLCLQAGN